MHGKVLALGVAALLLGGCSQEEDSADLHTEHVDRAHFRGVWPVSAEAGTLGCDSSKDSAVVFSPDGSAEVYAVNETAMIFAGDQGWRDFHEIWLDDPSGAQPKIDSTDFDSEGARLCAP